MAQWSVNTSRLQLRGSAGFTPASQSMARCHRRANDQIEKNCVSGTLTLRAFHPRCQCLHHRQVRDSLLQLRVHGFLCELRHPLERGLHFIVKSGHLLLT
jgi:hypothetical protein